MTGPVDRTGPSPPPRRIFLAHTSDMSKYPVGRSFVAAAKNGIEQARDAVVEMGTFGARPYPAAQVCRAEVRACGVLVLLAGFDYGTRVRDETHHSYTELEYETAVAKSIPRLVFLLDEEAPCREEMPESSADADQQAAFRRRLRESEVVASFRSPDQLTLLVWQALDRLREEWVDATLLPLPRGDEVERAELTTAVIDALVDARATTVALVGAGGFGKTRLAAMIARVPAVVEAFPGGRLWTNLRQDTSGAELAGVIGDLSRTLDPGLPLHTEPLAAGRQLGNTLRSGRTLLIVDNAWSSGQIEPFRHGDDMVLLLTTQRRDVLPAGTRVIDVLPMTSADSRALLTRGLNLMSEVVDRARVTCGSWPLLLSLVHGRVLSDVSTGEWSADESMRQVLDGLRQVGITALDVTDADARDRAVARTIELSLAALTKSERKRFRELAVFAVGVRVPLPVVARLWARTGGWPEFRSETFGLALLNRSLLVDDHRSGGLLIHDVIATYIREATASKLARWHRKLVDAHRDLAADWASVDRSHLYLWTWLPRHLHAAGLHTELDALRQDQRWLRTKSALLGPGELENDLLLPSASSAQDPPIAARIRRALPPAGVGAVSTRVTGELLLVMVERGFCSLDQAMDTIERMDNDAQAVTALELLADRAEPMSEELVRRAWGVASGLRSDRSWRALTALIPRLPDDLLDSAVTAVAARSAARGRLRVVAALIDRLPLAAAELGTRLPWSALPDMSDDDRRVVASLIALRRQVDGAAESALHTVASSRTGTYDQCRYLAVLTPRLPTSALDGILSALWACPARYRGDALLSLVGWVPRHRIRDVLDLVGETGWENTPPEADDQRPWLRLMAALGPRLAEPGEAAAALAVALALHGDSVAAAAVEALAPHLSEQLAADELRAMQGRGREDRWYYADERDTAVVVAALVSRLSDPDEALRMVRHQLVRHAAVDAELGVTLSERQTVHDATTLAPFTVHLPPASRRAVLQGVLQLFCFTGDDPFYLIPALVRMAPVVARDADLMSDVMATMATNGVWRPAYPATVVTALAKHLPRAELDTALDHVRSWPPDAAGYGVLAALGLELPAPERVQLAGRCLMVGVEMADEKQKVRAITALAPMLAPELAVTCLDLIKALNRHVLWPSIVAALEALVPRLPENGLARAVEVFVDTPMVDVSDLRRLPRLVTHLGRDETGAVRELFGNVSGSVSKPASWWLSALAPHLSAALAATALGFAREIQEEYERRALLAAVVPGLPDALRAGAAQEALDLLDQAPNRANDKVVILAPLAAAVDSDAIRNACRQLLDDDLRYGDLWHAWDSFLDLLACLPADLAVHAVEQIAHLVPPKRFEALRALAPRLPAQMRLDLVTQLWPEPSGPPIDGVTHARALLALLHDLPAAEHLLAALVARFVNRRWWWEIEADMYLDLIQSPRLPSAARDSVVTRAVRECFSARRPEAGQLLAVLDGDELLRALDELPRIEDHHSRTATLTALMRRAGVVGEPPGLFGDGHVLDHLPGTYDQSELFEVIGASAWWIRRQGGTGAVRATIDAVLDIVRRWR